MAQEPSGHHGRMMEEEVVIELHAGHASGLQGLGRVFRFQGVRVYIHQSTFQESVEGDHQEEP